MQTYDVTVNNHSIHLAYSLWDGSEVIRHDGVVVSDKQSFGLATKHSFVAEEEGEQVEYAVAMGGPIGYLIRRNGSVLGKKSTCRACALKPEPPVSRQPPRRLLPGRPGRWRGGVHHNL